MSDALGVALYFVASGDVFFLGLGLVAAGVVAGRRSVRVGSSFAWSGVALAVASAMPIHPAAYGLLIGVVLVWRLTRLKLRRLARPADAVALACVVGLAASALWEQRAPVVHVATENPVVVIGDSLSADLGSPAEVTWPRLVAASVGVAMSNRARAGATLADGLRQARDIPQAPTAVLVELGGNDLLDGTTQASFEGRLRALLGTLTGQGHRVFMFELPLLPLQNGYGRIQRQVGREYGVVLIPRRVLAGAICLPGHATDGLHLSARGHAWLARRVAKLLWGRDAA